MSKKILCVGSCGFILSNFVRKIIKDKLDYQICSIDVISSDEDIYNVYNNKNHNFYIGSTLDKHFLQTVFKIEKPDIVIQGALTNKKDCILNNLIGTDNLLELSKDFNAKLYLLSSDILYGAVADESATCDETKQIVTYNKYMASLLSTENFVSSDGGVVLRLSSVYGPRSKTGIIPHIINSHLNEKKPAICDMGYDITHVDDIISAILLVIEQGKEQLYNISSSHMFTEKEVFEELAKVLKLEEPEFHLNQNSTTTLYRSCDNSKLRSLGWKTKHTFQNWLPSVVQWYLNNQWFIK